MVFILYHLWEDFFFQLLFLSITPYITGLQSNILNQVFHLIFISHIRKPILYSCYCYSALNSVFFYCLATCSSVSLYLCDPLSSSILVVLLQSFPLDLNIKQEVKKEPEEQDEEDLIDKEPEEDDESGSLRNEVNRHDMLGKSNTFGHIWTKYFICSILHHKVALFHWTYWLITHAYSHSLSQSVIHKINER